MCVSNGAPAKPSRGRGQIRRTMTYNAKLPYIRIYNNPNVTGSTAADVSFSYDQGTAATTLGFRYV